MTSGVYQLTFSDGSRYIGKSVNIDSRWKQHYDKMCKGKSAKAVQAAFNRCGEPTGEILCECHKDHIDLIEAMFISRLNPELNSDRPSDPFEGEDMDKYFVSSLLGHSTLEHMNYMIQKKIEEADREREINLLERKIKEITIKRSSEELSTEAGVKLRNSETRNNYLLAEIHALKQDINTIKEELNNRNVELEYLRKPWWKRLFS